MAQLPAICEDVGPAFWSCVQTLGVWSTQPVPAFDATVQLEPDPEPSPRWDWPRLHCQQGDTRAKQRRDPEAQERQGVGPLVLVDVPQTQRAPWPRWATRRACAAPVDPGSLRRRRHRWHISKKAWKRRMRALRGNTVADMFNVAIWNAREFHADACPTREASRAKMLWILHRLQDEDVDVCFLLEVMGSQEAFTAHTHGMRALAKKIGYVVRWIVGEGGSQREQHQSSDSYTNSIAVLVKQTTCVIERHVRLEERVLGVWIKGRLEKEHIRTRIAAVHGLHHSGTSCFEKQLQATYEWAADASQVVKGCLVVGDFNYVADSTWRSSQSPLNVNDRLFRDFLSLPGTEYVPPVSSKPLIVWTRRGGDSTEVSSSDGCGAMLDGAVTIGAECGLWRRTVVDFAFTADGPSSSTARPLSDHAWVTFSREIPKLELVGEKRPLSALPRGDTRVKDGYRDRVRDGDVLEDILSVRGTLHATAAAVRSLRRAAEQCTAEAQERKVERPLETAHRWRRWLQ